MNPLLAYIDTRPLIFVAGWLLILLLWLGARKIRGYRGPMLLSAVAIHLGYGGLFILLATGWGSFVDQKEVRTMPIQWQIREEGPTAAGRTGMAGIAEENTSDPEVILQFVSHPNHRLNMFSKDLASHLQALEQDTISVTFEITRDYGRMRGFSTLDIAGLKQWDA
ncbi:MAG TPA: hypothetical protein DIV36_07205, partial [Verrucomicrobiales bacterium]|nr:hypothetical protein [Verrucomicrobiales bacterium]